MMTRRRTIVAACAAAVVVVAPAAWAPAASQAASYRYWSYWLGTDSGWSFASVGPAFRTPADGTIEGWRYAVTGVQGHQAPGLAADFAAVCAGTPPQDDRKRVAVVVDPGSSADAPDGEQAPGAWAMCVVAEPGASGYDILRAAATVRTDRGLICAIGGYPARGCAEVVADPTPAPTPTPTPTPSRTKTPEPTKSTSPTTESSATSKPATSTAATQSATPTATEQGESTEPTPSPTRSASPRAEASASPGASRSPSPSLASSANAAPGSVPPTPDPTYSLLTAPLQEPPSGSGFGGALVAGIAVAGIAGLGGAAILRMRRSS